MKIFNKNKGSVKQFKEQQFKQKHSFSNTSKTIESKEDLNCSYTQRFNKNKNSFSTINTYSKKDVSSNISKYEINDNRISRVKKIFLSEPKYSIKKGRPIYSIDYISCNCSIYVGEKYIYITMDPESMKEYNARQRREKQEGVRGSIKPGNDSYILVLDYDLNLIKSYLSDSDISNLALTSDPSVVYATNSRENRLIKYTLPGLN